ncbi:abnormal spindle-like microcephaly-associated protein isoform X2 [Gadus macrocephalus]|uniref:abnormal spindle-like microcephaly-associated protein isoform X2 n=1 Tax=Gadus macrocephalus TaxID=80720 RepID=UPI0028CB1BDB|nr:abnormal spindle-like microcephaly-associated protein isoform X2 [Gadus macrocephalus]
MTETSQRGLLEFSPIKKEDSNKENDVPVLSLIQFSRAPFVIFGTVKLGTSKSSLLRIENPIDDTVAVVTIEKISSTKGFSASHNRFIIQPDSTFTLTITWTPAEEGGIRELIVFSANGVLKHQAVLLGRAEATKKKKKSLWDSIKNNRAANLTATPRCKNNDASLKITANKTFQVPRKAHYKREKPRNPLTLFNEGIRLRERSLSETRSVEDGQEHQRPPKGTRRPKGLAGSDQAQVRHGQENTPVLLLYPAAELADLSNGSAVLLDLLGTSDHPGLTRVLNRTLSPVGTPEVFRRLMPHIQSLGSPVIEALPASENVREPSVDPEAQPLAPTLTVSDALALIDSDLDTGITHSSCDIFSDSLDSAGGSPDLVPVKPLLNVIPDSPDPSECNGQRCTFFVSKNKATSPRHGPPTPVIFPFTSPPELSSSPIHPRVSLTATSLSSLPPSPCTLPPFFRPLSSPVSVPLMLKESSSPAGFLLLPVCPKTSEALPPSVSNPAGSSPAAAAAVTSPLSPPPPPFSKEVLMFPVHTKTQLDLAKNKKRKSDEYLRSEERVEDVTRPDLVKRSRVVTTTTRESMRPVREKKRVVEKPQRQHGSSVLVRSTSASSIKSTRAVVPATTIPRHPMPFAAKNMFYDERWIEKQESGFTCWINYILTPDDFKVNLEVNKVNAISIAMGSDDKYSVPKAPTKEELSFSTYTASRRLNRLRRNACQLFTSEVMVKAIQRLELEVEAKRLLVRKDRHLWKDIGERQKVLNWLLSYNPLWLRIGLETIFGELIPLESNSDVLGLAMFILTRLLWNPDIATEFRHAKVPHLYKDGHEEVLSRFTLKKLLLLVCFLDKAKESRLIEHDPCLFCMDAEFKTSKDLMLSFSRDFLSGEGNLPRHMGYIGLPVSHVQTPLDEFNFAVKNLAVDLKCGIRLVRVMELFLQDWSLSRRLRLPAISRLQKVHNVDIAFQVLKAKGVDLRDEQGSIIDSRDIVDGHREKTLSLLWKIIFAFQVEVILDETQLREEIGFLKSTLRTKQKLASLKADRGLQQSSAGRGPAPLRFQTSSTKIGLLMEWINAVCDYYNLRVENFTVSFSDGRVLCYLIHHYHPEILQEQAISHSTTQTVDCSPLGRVELDCSNSDSDSSFNIHPSVHKGLESPSFEFKDLLEKEKNNFRLVNSAVAFLGGVPAMINPTDMSNTIPNEKVVTSYLSFLCSRLLDLRNETRAARVIQGAWRNYRLMKDLVLYQQRNVAAAKIQVLVKSFLQRRRAERERSAAILIQARWRGYAARNALRLKREAQLWALQHNAATIIQARWKMYSAKRSYQCLRYHVVIVQAQWRMRRAAISYCKIHSATTLIQTYTRAWALARRERGKYISLRTAAVEIQRGFRRWRALRLARKHRAAIVIQAAFRKWHLEKETQRSAAALKIQSWYRMLRCVRQFLTLRTSAVLIQALFRGRAQRSHLQTLMLQQRSTLVIQSAFRGHAVRKHLAKKRLAAVIVQRWFRACVKRNLERQSFLTLKHAAITMQALHRGNTARGFLRKKCSAATVIQAAFRRFAAERRFLALKTATTVIQQWYRAMILAHKTREEYKALKGSAVVIQRVWRGRADRKRLERLHEYATLIQASYRRHRAQELYRSTKLAAVVLQYHFRACMARKIQRAEYLQLKAAAITLQANFRGMKVRMQLDRKHRAATLIQSVGRMLICRKRYLLLQSATIIVQSRYRALIEGRVQQFEYRQQRQAAINIQAAYRGSRVRRGLRKQHTAATAIQANFRMYTVRMAYLATRCAAIILQERYRAQRLGIQQARRYMAMRSAAVIFQAGYRAHMVRQKLSKMQRAAIVIQRWFQASRDRRHFLVIKATALLFQRTYRAVVQTREIRSEYLLRRRAAISLQAAYRGMKDRQHLQLLHRAAVKIQSYFRMLRQRTYYKNLHWATTTVQCRYKNNKKMREKILTLNAQINAVVVLQAAFRGMKNRRLVRRMHQAASAIQQAYRAHCERKCYLTLKSSALTLQRCFRANLAAKHQLQHYQQIRRSVILLQAAYRGQQARKEISHQHRAATVIQASFRKHREQVKFKAMRLSTIILQRNYRSLILKRADRGHFLKVKQSAIVLQAAFRGMVSRRNTNQMHQAANTIQQAYRAHCERRVYLALKSSAIKLQQRFRANLVAKHQLQKYQQIRRAAILLQVACRGQQARKTIIRQHRAATVIQASFRKHREQVNFKAMRLSTIIIQRYYRSFTLLRADRGHFLKVKQSAIVLQAAYRGHCVRMNISKMQSATTVIQANYRRYKQQSCFRRIRWAACILQQRFRSQRMQSLEMKHYQHIRRAIITLQAAFRGMIARQAVRRMHQAASVIQQAYRAHCKCKSYLTLKSSALTLQRRFRANLTAKHQLQHYQQIRRAVILLQAAYRGQRVRKAISHQHQAATMIQASFRKHREQVKFKAMQLSTIIIQQYYRSCVLQRADRGHFLKVKQAAIVLQAAYRGHCVRMNISKMQSATTVIQANYRRYKQQSCFRRLRWAACVLQQRFRSQRMQCLEMKHYQHIRRAIITLQAAFRGMIARQAVRRMHQAASVIQQAYRAHCKCKSYLTLKSSALTLQRRFRANLTAKHQLQHYQQIRRSVILLQAAYRGQRVRKTISHQHQAATMIQASFRKHREQVKFKAMQLSTIIIQQYYRSCVLQRADRGHFLKVKQAAIVLQAAFKGHLIRRSINEQNHAATLIQSHWRSLVQRLAFQRLRDAAMTLQRILRAVWLAKAKKQHYMLNRRAAVILQAHFRGWIARRQLLEAAKAEKRLRFIAVALHHISAMKIQRALRAHWALQSAKKEIHSVIAIQRWVRAWQQRRRYLEERRNVVTVQRIARRWLARRHRAASVIQHEYRRFLLLRRQQKVLQGVIKAQALWRGHRSRKLRDVPKVVAARQRLHKVSAGVREEDKLGNKTASALEYLLRYRHFSYILEALKNLETATRLSPECCERLVESGATQVIFSLIRSCNRSVPCMDVITFSIQILLNLSKYHKTIAAVYLVENSVETLLDLLQRYREKAGDKVADKGGSIFTKACFLLALLLQDRHRALEVSKLPKALDRIRSVYRLTARKYKMDTERTIIKHKMNSAGSSSSFLAQPTPRKSRPVRRFAPDWVLQKDKLSDIVDPLGAIKMVADTFSIVL